MAKIFSAAMLPGVIGSLYLVLGGCDNSPEAQVRRVISDFATAVDTGDQAKIVDLLCAEEAAAITEDDDYDPAATGAAAAPLDRQISDILITGDTASAKVSFSTQESITIHLRQENGTWHLCTPHYLILLDETPPMVIRWARQTEWIAGRR